MRDVETIHQIVPEGRLQCRRAGVEVGEAHQHQLKVEHEKGRRVELGQNLFTGGRGHMWSWDESREAVGEGGLGWVL